MAESGFPAFPTAEEKRHLQNHVSSICIPNPVYRKNFADFLVFGDSVREIIDPSANETLEMSNGSFREPVMRTSGQLSELEILLPRF